MIEIDLHSTRIYEQIDHYIIICFYVVSLDLCSMLYNIYDFWLRNFIHHLSSLYSSAQSAIALSSPSIVPLLVCVFTTTLKNDPFSPGA